MRRAKIVCTLGPATSTPEAIDALVAAGMDCARLNFSHGTHESHGRIARMVREASRRAGRPLAILADLCGPKMRIGKFPGGPVELVPGQTFTLTTRDVDGDATQVSHIYEPLARDVVPGDHILLDDGLLNLKVLETTDTDVITEVEVGGTLSDRKGMNVPGANLSTPALTDKDRVDLEFAVEELEVDYVALSFVRTADDVLQAQQLAQGTPVIAKLEKPEAIKNLDAICDVADGAMVARGDLGVEVGSEKVPLIQKRIIRSVNDRGKLVITATQMLDSMIRNPRPTRAEAADVANAVLDGSDAVMLSGETAAGKYPVKAVQMMDLIIPRGGGGAAGSGGHLDPHREPRAAQPRAVALHGRGGPGGGDPLFHPAAEGHRDLHPRRSDGAPPE
jgi:pyruvate kinase